MIHGKPIEILTRFVALRLLVAVVAVASATVDTARAHGGDPTGSTDVASVSEQWAKLWSAKNLDGVVALYAEDAVFLPSTGTRVEGRDAILEIFKSALAAYDTDITYRSKKSEIVVDLA
ncbi:MAG TPA: SgcJ/EcaC family oxidoreductase [Blastocatellia bacterium]|nr:SgcJ/EcaC family oxidoreductase [Blastocatellia bacterium]